MKKKKRKNSWAIIRRKNRGKGFAIKQPEIFVFRPKRIRAEERGEKGGGGNMDSILWRMTLRGEKKKKRCAQERVITPPGGKEKEKAPFEPTLG